MFFNYCCTVLLHVCKPVYQIQNAWYGEEMHENVYETFTSSSMLSVSPDSAETVARTAIRVAVRQHVVRATRLPVPL